jgi:hypothetical protein
MTKHRQIYGIPILISIILTLSLILGCAPQQNAQQQGNEEYRVGSQGLVLRFIPNLPPVKNYPGAFATIIEIKNTGAAEVGASGDRVYLSGFDPNIITGIPLAGAPIPPGLEGKSYYNFEGGYDTVEFSGEIRFFEEIDRIPATLLATACYNYETIAVANVCVDPDPYSPISRSKVCDPASVEMKATQGAPVAVSSVQVEPAKGKTKFKIIITNVGTGTVFKYGADYINKCSPYDQSGLRYDEVDYVQLSDVRIGGTSIADSCKPVDDNHVRLSQGRGTIFCEMDGLQGSDAYKTPLVIDLAYGYRDTITTSIEIFPSR